MADESTPPAEVLTVPGAVARAAEHFGHRTAIEDGSVTLDFDELAVRVGQAAAAFVAAGIAPGERAAIWAPNRYEWIVAALGLESVGGVLVPINTRFKGAEARYVLQKSRARWLFTQEALLGNRYVDLLREGGAVPSTLEGLVLFEGTAEGGESWDAFLARGDGVDAGELSARREAVQPGDALDILFTSGTTGQPKGVVTSHEQTLRAYWAWSGVVGLAEGDRYLIVNPFFHAFGYKAGFLACLLRGATILPHAVFDVPEVLARVGRERVSVLPGPPTLYQTILAHPDRQKYDLGCLRLAVTGAASIPVSLIEAMRDELGFDTVITGYGLTEATGIATMCRHDDDPETIAKTSGRAIPGVEVRTVNDAGEAVAAGAPGEVVVRGYNVMQGYFEDEAATREAIDADGWLHTGDIGVLDERGYLRITDRKKDMFIVGGFNCYPAEIENLISAHPDIAQVAVVGAADERLGDVAVAFVVPRPGQALKAEEIIAWCRERMANYKVPRAVHLVDALPLNASGKVQKFLLRERLAGDGG